MLLLVTGLIMAQFYNPSVNGAHKSLQYLMDKAFLGWFVRGIHHWAAQFIVVTLLLHLGRVIITGTYKKPREVTFYIGLLLLFLMVVMIFTGTIVKWDQEGYEALAHFTGIAAMFGFLGRFFLPAFTASTHILSRIFALHISAIPFIIFGVLTVHLFLVKVLRISPLPWKSLAQQKETATFTEHIKLLVKVTLGITAFIMLLALLFRPPLGAAPIGMETGVKPPWMFLWLYALENKLGLPGIIYGFAGLFGLLALLPLVDGGEERHPAKRPLAMGILTVIVIFLVVLSIIGYLSVPVVHSGM